ncbi:membrane-bound ClpP family serine protease [Thermonema lapsum]|uniref:Membrane-bound ClpP family serine protease n=1 Tax=Thermonema lapsum TaxID=28195 RepID=A0A846MQV1_9BACT|nr:NfeD family protein [Thermonema lapsum]NIK73835.1 membrane-bound ClpP family serine protease [Thermonema lapsum]
MIVIFTLLLVALLLFLLEIFVIPGTSIAALLALMSWITAVVWAFMESPEWGAALTVGSLLLGALGLRYFPTSHLLKRFSLKSSLPSGKDTPAEIPSYLGSALAISDLKPYGRIELPNGGQYDARSLSGYISSGNEVEVVKAEKKYYLVRAVPSSKEQTRK